MKNNSPSNIWNDMAPGSFRRVDAEIKHNIFWFRDIHGAYGLRISLTQLFKRELDEKLEGVSLLRRNKGSNGELFILLTNNEDWEIFLVLCLNLISISDRYLDESAMLPAVENRLSRWKNILKQGRNNTLSREKQMGLITELLCLKDQLTPKLGIKSALISWVGCHHDKQDFITEKTLIEVKSFQITKGKKVSISSLEQLNSQKEPLYLLCYGISISENGLSIGSIVDEIYENYIKESFDLMAIFENKLFEYGYIHGMKEEPQMIHLTIESFDIYKVHDAFPKLDVNNVDSRISKVKYSIDLDQCDEFIVNSEEII